MLLITLERSDERLLVDELEALLTTIDNLLSNGRSILLAAISHRAKIACIGMMRLLSLQ